MGFFVKLRLAEDRNRVYNEYKEVNPLLEATLPGTGGMMPLRDRALACAILRHQGKCVLIDCGEGTQVRIHDCGYAFKSIDAILLTHFHADHVSGLPGLLLSMSNQGRTESITIAGPKGVQTVVNALRIIAPKLPFEIRFHEIEDSTPFSVGELLITPFALRHSVECVGYCLHLPRSGKFLPERAKALGIPVALWSVLQKQKSVEWNGETFTQESVMTPPRKGITVLYATDTRPVEEIALLGRDADLMILEGMYGESEKRERAREVGHMMMDEAAALAARANAKEMWFTHYSPAMKDAEIYMPAIREIFPNARAASDGESVCLRFEE